MTRDYRWLSHWEEVMRFMDDNRRNPSRHRPEERNMVNWLKANRKLRNAGKMAASRVVPFKRLTDRMASLRRLNQYTTPAQENN